MSDEVNWWAGAHLCLRARIAGASPTELFRGHLLEAVHLALERPEAERPRLYVQCETIDRELPWPKIAKLAARPDFPGLI